MSILLLLLLPLLMSPASGFFFPQFFRRFSGATARDQVVGPGQDPLHKATFRIVNYPTTGSQASPSQQRGQVLPGPVAAGQGQLHVPKELCIACEEFPWHPVEGNGGNNNVIVQPTPPQQQQQQQQQPSQINEQNRPHDENQLPSHFREVTVVVNALGRGHPHGLSRQPFSFDFGQPPPSVEVQNQASQHMQQQQQEDAQNQIKGGDDDEGNQGVLNQDSNEVSEVVVKSPNHPPPSTPYEPPSNDVNTNDVISTHNVNYDQNNVNQAQDEKYGSNNNNGGGGIRTPQFSQPPPNPGFNVPYNPFVMQPPPPPQQHSYNNQGQQQQPQPSSNQQQYQRPSVLQPVRIPIKQGGYSTMNEHMEPPLPPLPPPSSPPQGYPQPAQGQPTQSYPQQPPQQGYPQGPQQPPQQGYPQGPQVKPQPPQQGYPSGPNQHPPQQYPPKGQGPPPPPPQQGYPTGPGQKPQKYNFRLIKPSGFSVVHSKNPKKPYALPPLAVGSIVAAHQQHTGSTQELQPAKLIYQDHSQGQYRGPPPPPGKNQQKHNYGPPPPRPQQIKIPTNFGSMTLNQVPLEQVPHYIQGRPPPQPPKNYGAPPPPPPPQNRPYGPPPPKQNLQYRPGPPPKQVSNASSKRPQFLPIRFQAYGPPVQPGYSTLPGGPFPPPPHQQHQQQQQQYQTQQQQQQQQTFGNQPQQSMQHLQQIGEQYAENRPSKIHFVQNVPHGTFGFATSGSSPSNFQSQKEPDAHIQVSSHPPPQPQQGIPLLLQLHPVPDNESGDLSNNVYQYEVDSNTKPSSGSIKDLRKLEEAAASTSPQSSLAPTSPTSPHFTSEDSFGSSISPTGPSPTNSGGLVSIPLTQEFTSSASASEFVKNPHLQSIDESPVHSYVKDGDFEIIPATQYDITHLFNPPQSTSDQPNQIQFQLQPSAPSNLNENPHINHLPLPLPIPIPQSGLGSNSNSSPPLFVISRGNGQPPQGSNHLPEHKGTSPSSPSGPESTRNPFSFGFPIISPSQNHNQPNFPSAFPHYFDPLPPSINQSIVSALLHSTKTSSLTHSHFAEKGTQPGGKSGDGTIYINSVPVRQAPRATPSSSAPTYLDATASASANTQSQSQPTAPPSGTSGQPQVVEDKAQDQVQVNCNHEKWVMSTQGRGVPQFSGSSHHQVLSNNDQDQYILKYYPSTAPQSSVYWVESPDDPSTTTQMPNLNGQNFIYSIGPSSVNQGPTGSASNNNIVQFSKQIFPWSPKIQEPNGNNGVELSSNSGEETKSTPGSFTNSINQNPAPFDILNLGKEVENGNIQSLGEKNTGRKTQTFSTFRGSSTFVPSPPVRNSVSDSRPFSSKFVKASSAPPTTEKNDLALAEFSSKRIKTPKLVDIHSHKHGKNCSDHPGTETPTSTTLEASSESPSNEVELITAPPTTFSPTRIKTRGRDKIKFRVGARFPARRPSVTDFVTEGASTTTTATEIPETSEAAAVHIPIYRPSSLAPIFRAPASHVALEDIYKKSEISQGEPNSLIDDSGITPTATTTTTVSSSSVRMTSRKVGGALLGGTSEGSGEGSSSEEVSTEAPPNTSTKVIKTVRVRQRMRPGGSSGSASGGVSSFFGSKSLSGGLRGRPSRVRVVQRPVSQDYIKSFPEFAQPEGDDLGKEEEEEALKDALIEIKKI